MEEDCTHNDYIAKENNISLTYFCVILFITHVTVIAIELWLELLSVRTSWVRTGVLIILTLYVRPNSVILINPKTDKKL